MPKGLKCTENVAKAVVVDVFLMQIIIFEVLVMQIYTDTARMKSKII